MKLYNTLTRQKEEFVPLNPDGVTMYSCGPTVYNYFHIGNARPFIIFDTLRRYLKYRGYKVTYVQNFTDIDDKLIRKAIEENSTVREIADKYIREYFIDAQGLGIEKADFHPKATEHIPEIISIIEKLIEKGLAYETDGDVYFSAKNFEGYGKLSHFNLEELEAGSRVSVDERKREPMDFALWKAQKPGEPGWESPWGIGRPGWHIECSAMAGKYLGETIDIHSGGVDLIFPHHENEIAQSEGASGKPFARYWLHNAFLNIDNQKMSKSSGNFFTVRDAAAHYDYEVIRFFMLSAHYRSPINYSAEQLEQAKNALNRLYECKRNLEFLIKNAPLTEGVEAEKLLVYRDKFIEAMDDDLNTADAIAAIFELVKEINVLSASQLMDKQSAESALSLFNELCGVLGIARKSEDSLDSEVEELIKQRQQARLEKNWKLSDEIRDKLKAMGIELQDTPQGVKWRKI